MLGSVQASVDKLCQKYDAMEDKFKYSGFDLQLIEDTR